MNNLVYCPVVPISYTDPQGMLADCVSTANDANATMFATVGFCQFGIAYKNLVKHASSTATTYTIHSTAWEATEQTTKNINIRLASYMLKPAFASALAGKYKDVPLLFPYQRIRFRDLSQPIGNHTSNPEVDLSIDIDLKNVDTGYFVFKQHTTKSTTCWYNPGIEYDMLINGKQYPGEKYNTVYDVKNRNQLLDAMNVNGSHSRSIPRDMKTSLQPYVSVQKMDASGTVEHRWTTGDMSSFMIAIPFADATAFQGGLTTGPTQLQFLAKRCPHAPGIYKKLTFAQPVFIYSCEDFLLIRSVKPEGQPQIVTTNARFEELGG
jgi:hypothetical protein